MKEITMEELKQMRIWMLWHRKEADGRVAKIPCSAKGKACGTSSDYVNEWVTYQEAQHALTKVRADGIGFKIPEGMFFLDIPIQKSLLLRLFSLSKRDFICIVKSEKLAR